MANMQNTSATTKAGFSLIELIVVVSIIGILAAIGVPVYRTYALKAKVAKNVQYLHRVSKELQVIYGKAGTFPTSIQISGATIPNNVGWVMVNGTDVHSAYYAGGGAAMILAVTIKGLQGIPGYTSPIAAEPGSTRSGIVYSFREINGVIRSVCGISGPAYVIEDVPLEYLPSTCQCSNINAFVSSGTISAGC